MNDIEKYEAVEKVIDEHIRPYLMSDGGNVDLELVLVVHVHLVLVEH